MENKNIIYFFILDKKYDDFSKEEEEELVIIGVGEREKKKSKLKTNDFWEGVI